MEARAGRERERAGVRLAEQPGSPTSGLSIRGLDVAYGGVRVVHDVDVDLLPGQVLAVLGPSGCGKSTLLRAVAGLEPPAAGSIAWDGADLAGTPTHRRGFALMFQDGQLFGHLTVAGNVGYALRLRHAPDLGDRVVELLDLVGLTGYADRLPATLSGGERQRVALARCLAVRPRLLLLDEPLSALDTGLRERLALDVAGILRREGTTALMVTHDHEEAFAVADRLAVMRAGRVVQQGEIGAVWRAPVDAETALSLGYARVLEGVAADRLVPGSTRLAIRRSALRLDPDGVLDAEVRAARSTPDQVRLVVDIDGVGEVDAVAALGRHPGPGEQVRLSVDVTRVAPVGVEPGRGPGLTSLH